MRAIFNCKACKITVAKEYSVLRTVTHGPGGMYTRRIMGRINEYGREMLASNDYVICSECRNTMSSAMVRGTKTDHVCDERCTEAKGSKCECSCGGANHGKSYLC